MTINSMTTHSLTIFRSCSIYWIPGIVCAFAAFIGSGEIARAGTRIDINPDNGRSDVRTAEAFNWPVGSAERTVVHVDGVQVQLRSSEPASRIAFAWWKAGYDHGPHPLRMA